MQDKYRFLKTATHNGEVVALIADQAILGEAGVSNLRNAFRANAAPLIRTGVMTLNEEELKQQLERFKSEGGDMPESIAAFKRAIDCVHLKKSGQAGQPLDSSVRRITAMPLAG